MPAGFQVWGDHGVGQIDGDYANVALRHKFTLGGDGQIDLDAIMPAFFLRPIEASFGRIGHGTDTYFGSAAVQILSIGTNRWRLKLASWVNTEVFVFDLPRWTASNFGRQVFDANGQLVFDSGMKYLRIVGGGGGGTHDGHSVLGRDNGRKLAFCMGGAGYWYEVDSPDESHDNVMVVSEAIAHAGGGTFVLGAAQRNNFNVAYGSGVSWVAQGQGSVLVADVTGY